MGRMRFMEPRFSVKPPPQQVREKAIAYCVRVRKPILIGYLAADLGWWASLRETEALLEDLVAEGICRRLTPAECREFGIMFGYASV